MGTLSGRGLVRGSIASIAGLAAMGAYFRVVAALSNDDPEQGRGADDESEEKALDDISIAGLKTREEESATQTVGRLAHEAVIGEEPDADRAEKLGQAVHWGYGILVGGLYGAIRDARAREGLDLGAGLGYGAVLWLLGDEVAVPALGLAKGPTAHPPGTHATTLGAHLVYGAATSVANRILCRVM